MKKYQVNMRRYQEIGTHNMHTHFREPKENKTFNLTIPLILNCILLHVKFLHTIVFTFRICLAKIEIVNNRMQILPLQQHTYTCMCMY